MVTSLFTAYGVQHLKLLQTRSKTFHNKTSGGTSQQQTASETCFLSRTTLLFAVTTLPNKGTTQYMRGNLPQMITAYQNRRNVTVTTSRKTATRKTGAATKSSSRGSPFRKGLQRRSLANANARSRARSLFTPQSHRRKAYGLGSRLDYDSWWISASASG